MTAQPPMKQSPARGKRKAPATLPVFREFNPSLQPVYLALDAAGTGIWDWNLDENVVSWSSGIDEMFATAGRTPSKSCAELFRTIPREDLDSARETLEEVLGTYRPGERFELQIRVQRPNGELRWIEIVGSIGRSANLRLLGTVRDITHRCRINIDAAHPGRK